MIKKSIIIVFKQYHIFRNQKREGEFNETNENHTNNRECQFPIIIRLCISSNTDD